MDIPGRERLLDERPEGGDVGLDLAAEVEPLAVGHDGDPVVADGTADEDFIADGKTVVPYHLLGDADPGGVDDDGVERAPLEDFGVPRDEVCPALPECCVHRRDDPFEVGDLEAFGDDHAAREGDRPPAHHREVVDGSADGDPPDIPAGEEDRRDYVVVGREDDVLAVQWDDCAVVQRFEPDPAGIVVLEVGDDAQELAHHLAAGTVHEVDFHSSSTSISMLVTTISIPATISGSFPHRGQTNRSSPS